MKLFDIIGDKIVVHAEMWALPPFQKYWESTKDKKHANDVATFIILCDYWNSPYVKSMTPDVREKRLKLSKFGDENYQLTLDEQLCRDEYKALINTRLLKVKGTVQTIDFLEKAVKAEEMDNTKVRGNTQINPYELDK